jgi:hypothetical protein
MTTILWRQPILADWMAVSIPEILLLVLYNSAVPGAATNDKNGSDSGCPTGRLARRQAEDSNR